MIHVAQTACYSWTCLWESSFTDTFYILSVIYCIFFFFFNKANNKHRQPLTASQDNMYFEYFRPLLWSTLAGALLKTHKSSFCNQLQADSRGNTATWSCKLIRQIYLELLRLVHTLKHKSPPCLSKQKVILLMLIGLFHLWVLLATSKAELWDEKKTAELHPLAHIFWSLQVCLFAFISTRLKEILKRPQRTKDLMI